MTTTQEQSSFAKMTTEELQAYQSILGCSKNTVYIDPENRVSRHHSLVSEELANRE